MNGHLVLLLTSPRVAPGLLTLAAWEALRGARVFASRADHDQAGAVAAVGATIDVLESGDTTALARTLIDAARSTPDVRVVWLGSADGDPGLADAIATEVMALPGRGEPAPEVEVVTGSYDLPGARLLDLVAVMDRLRSPGGCPWDRKQTHRSLATYLVEEAYETLDAIETGHPTHLREELGDLLLQVVFHARIAEERPEEPWSIDDVAAGIVEKLISRHPHVFGDTHAPTAEHVEANWHLLKASEKGRESAVEGLPPGLPALALAAKLMSRAEKAGISVPVPAPDLDADLGDLLLSVVALARARDVDPEQALRDAARRYAAAVRAAEQSARG